LEENAAYLTAEFVKHDLHREGQAGDRGGGEEGTRWSSMVGGRAGRASRREAASAGDEKKAVKIWRWWD
jgi:hypothetical protein